MQVKMFSLLCLFLTLMPLASHVEAKVTKSVFGEMPDGSKVEIYALEEGALKARVMTYGARLVSPELDETLLPTDASVLPASPRTRSSWNYVLSSCSAEHPRVQVSYYMNRLQRLSAAQDYVVTLNPDPEPPDRHVLARMSYAHPVYDQAALDAQRRLPGLNDGVTAYAGAYHGWGFHEDGCRAGLTAAESLGGCW